MIDREDGNLRKKNDLILNAIIIGLRWNMRKLSLHDFRKKDFISCLNKWHFNLISDYDFDRKYI